MVAEHSAYCQFPGAIAPVPFEWPQGSDRAVEDCAVIWRGHSSDVVSELAARHLREPHHE